MALDGEPKYRVGRLRDPDRIYIDLADTRVAPALHGQRIPVGDSLLRQVRIGQNQPSIARVVADLNSVPDFTVTALDDPTGLMLQLRMPGTLREIADSPGPGQNSVGNLAHPDESATPEPEKTLPEDVEHGKASLQENPTLHYLTIGQRLKVQGYDFTADSLVAKEIERVERGGAVEIEGLVIGEPVSSSPVSLRVCA
jgi:hypothetical protein